MPKISPPPPAPSGDLVRIEVAAELFQVTPRTVRDWISTGLITGYRIGPKLLRVDLEQIRAELVTPIPTIGTLR